jgi:hypothetical protein
MAKTADKPRQTTDLQRLTQSDVAWLAGKPVSWVKENVHLLGRNADGSYNGRDVLAGLTRSHFEPAELSDADTEMALTIAEYAAPGFETTRRAAIRNLKIISDRYGAAGMATVANLLLAELKNHLKLLGDSHLCVPPTPEEIQTEAEERIADLPNWGARNDLRIVGLCNGCNKYRWGRRWLELPQPTGYVTSELTCPKCAPKG